ncbi:uncharacterized protein [Musca autumnalis]|uniref:uncharacterized protein n=1 Tax=Musca autumnalis TaxID=221902 RepID=UPI003CE850D4
MGKHGMGIMNDNGERKWRGSLVDVRTKRSTDIDSDHELVVATLKIKLKSVRDNNTQHSQRRFNTHMLKTEEKRIEVANSLSTHILPNNVSSWEDTCNMLRSIAKTHVGYTKKSERKDWISDYTWNLIQERKCLKQQALGDVQSKERYKDVAKMLKRSARNDERNFAEAMAKEAEAGAGSNNMRELHKIIKRLSNNSQTRTQAIRDTNGKLLTNVEEQTKRWKQHFEDISNMNGDDYEPNHQQNYGNQMPDDSIITNAPTISEIATAINKFKRNKAPGEDAIPPELLQVDPTTSAKILHTHINEAWSNERLPNAWTKGIIIKLPKKGDLKQCDNWRGITLLNTVYKIIAIIINERLQPIEGTLRDEQPGFRPHRSCVDQTNTLRIFEKRSILLNEVQFGPLCKKTGADEDYKHHKGNV